MLDVSAFSGFLRRHHSRPRSPVAALSWFGRRSMKPGVQQSLRDHAFPLECIRFVPLASAHTSGQHRRCVRFDELTKYVAAVPVKVGGSKDEVICLDLLCVAFPSLKAAAKAIARRAAQCQVSATAVLRVVQPDRPPPVADSAGRCNTLAAPAAGGVLLMTRRSRIYYSDSQKALMWERWKAGETLHRIAHLFDRSHSSVHRILAETGGIRPPERRRSRLALSLAEREEISRYLVEGLSIRSIADRLGRAPSTISREITRNGGQVVYRATQADQEAWRRAHRPKPCKLIEHPGLARIVTAKLQSQWSPEQIAGWLKHTYPGDQPLRVTRDDLPQPVHPSARRSEARAAAALATDPRHAAF